MNTVINMKQLIPHGRYCYDENGVCPTWGLSPNMPAQGNGYCTYMMVKDWVSSKFQEVPLLCSMVKCCGINEGDE